MGKSKNSNFDSDCNAKSQTKQAFDVCFSIYHDRVNDTVFNE